MLEDAIPLEDAMVCGTRLCSILPEVAIVLEVAKGGNTQP